jgi:predicted ribosomally synthesized peptide with SipW-like signal peptide
MGGDGTTSSRPTRSVKLRAALAAATVLGLTAGITLASWSDAEYVRGSLTASTFGIQSNVAGGGFADHPSAPGAAFTVQAGGMYAGATAYTPVLLRTIPASVAGTAALSGATLGGSGAATLGAALRYRVVLLPTPSTTCDATAFTGTSTYLVGGSSTTVPLTTAQQAGTIALTANQGTSTGLCFEISLPTTAPTSLAGLTATATWTLTGTSS